MTQSSTIMKFTRSFGRATEIKVVDCNFQIITKRLFLKSLTEYDIEQKNREPRGAHLSKWSANLFKTSDSIMELTTILWKHYITTAITVSSSQKAAYVHAFVKSY